MHVLSLSFRPSSVKNDLVSSHPLERSEKNVSVYYFSLNLMVQVLIATGSYGFKKGCLHTSVCNLVMSVHQSDFVILPISS